MSIVVAPLVTGIVAMESGQFVWPTCSFHGTIRGSIDFASFSLPRCIEGLQEAPDKKACGLPILIKKMGVHPGK